MHRVSMLRMLEEGTYEWYDQKRSEAEAEQNPALALEYAVKALEVTKPNSRQYARAAFFVANYQDDEQQKLLIRTSGMEFLLQAPERGN